jgi:hypothetical protein
MNSVSFAQGQLSTGEKLLASGVQVIIQASTSCIEPETSYLPSITLPGISLQELLSSGLQGKKFYRLVEYKVQILSKMSLFFPGTGITWYPLSSSFIWMLAYPR